MSEELLKRATNLNFDLTVLKSNKTYFKRYLSESYQSRQMQFEITAGNNTEVIYLTIEEEDFKNVAFVLNEINERKLQKKQTEFDNCFNTSAIPVNKQSNG